MKTFINRLKYTSLINHIWILRSKNKIRNIIFLFKYLFQRKKVIKNIKNSYIEKKFKSHNEKLIILYQSKFMKGVKDNFFIKSEIHQITDLIKKKYKKDIKYFYDIGAKVGVWSLCLNNIFNNMQINCFEPSTITFDILKKNISKNKLNNTKLYNLALADKNSFEYISLPINLIQEGNYFSDGHFSLKGNSLFYRERVETKMIDSILQINSLNLNKEIFFFKIDTEGYELEILKGGIKTFSQIKNLILVLEFSKKMFYFSKENYLNDFSLRLELLKNMGFKKIYYIINDEINSIEISQLNLSNFFKDKHVLNFIFMKF
jgi:FkbM family methyltransferase